MENNKQYKGIFYNQKASHKFYEGGAHFSYYSLVKILKSIKEDLNRNREEREEKEERETEKEEEKYNQKKRETPEEENNEKNQKKDLKKINIPILNKLRNKSMNCLLDNNTNQKKEVIYAKNINERPQRESSNLNILKIMKKPKKIEYSNSVKRSNALNKYFNNSIYNNSNINNINMPYIYNQNNRSENKSKNNDKNIILKKNTLLEPLKKKYKNNMKMSSTIGFNENEKFFNYYFLNNYKFQNKISRNKNANASSSISQSMRKHNNCSNSQIIEKYNSINNYKNNNFQNIQKRNKINNSNNVDFNISNNFIKLQKNNNKLNYTRVNFNKEKGNYQKFLANDDKKKERMNLSIINFSLLKNNNKFLFDKKKFVNYQL
jgi:hypothetical protein